MHCGHFVFGTLVTRIIRPILMIQDIEYGSIPAGLVKLAYLGRFYPLARSNI
jgi:hypothetical protein